MLTGEGEAEKERVMRLLEMIAAKKRKLKEESMHLGPEDGFVALGVASA